MKFGGKKYRLIEVDSDPDRQALDADLTGSTFGSGSTTPTPGDVDPVSCFLSPFSSVNHEILLCC